MAPALVRELCQNLDLAHVVDPMQTETVTPEQTYPRLHGTSGMRHVPTDDELRRLRDLVRERAAVRPFSTTCRASATPIASSHCYHRRMAMTTAGVDEVQALCAAATLFRGLGDPNRLAILRHLALGEHRVRDLTDHLGLAQSTVSAHCLCLAECGLISLRPQGRATLYSLARPELLEVLAAAEKLLAATGDAVTLCPTSGGSR